MNVTEALNIVNNALTSLEQQMDITVRWTPDNPHYREALENIGARNLNRSIDTVEHLMVQRFLEQDKLQVAGICKLVLSPIPCKSHNII